MNGLINGCMDIWLFACAFIIYVEHCAGNIIMFKIGWISLPPTNVAVRIDHSQNEASGYL